MKLFQEIIWLVFALASGPLTMLGIIKLAAFHDAYLMRKKREAKEQKHD